jgi:hypothetical protein
MCLSQTLAKLEQNSINVSPAFPSSRSLRNVCSVKKLTEYFAEALRRLVLVDKAAFAAFLCVSIGVVPLLFLFCSYRYCVDYSASLVTNKTLLRHSVSQ